MRALADTPPGPRMLDLQAQIAGLANGEPVRVSAAVLADVLFANGIPREKANAIASGAQAYVIDPNGSYHPEGVDDLL
jgi:hypothetical protein